MEFSALVAEGKGSEWSVDILNRAQNVEWVPIGDLLEAESDWTTVTMTITGGDLTEYLDAGNDDEILVRVHSESASQVRSCLALHRVFRRSSLIRLNVYLRPIGPDMPASFYTFWRWFPIHVPMFKCSPTAPPVGAIVRPPATNRKQNLQRAYIDFVQVTASVGGKGSVQVRVLVLGLVTDSCPGTGLSVYAGSPDAGHTWGDKLDLVWTHAARLNDNGKGFSCTTGRQFTTTNCNNFFAGSPLWLRTTFWMGLGASWAKHPCSQLVALNNAGLDLRLEYVPRSTYVWCTRTRDKAKTGYFEFHMHDNEYNSKTSR